MGLPTVHCCTVDGYCWQNKFFFLTNNKVEGANRNFYVQMIGTKEECRGYRVGITLLNKEKKPFPVEMDEEDKKDAGLVVRNKVMEEVCKPKAGKENMVGMSIALSFEAI